MLLWSLLIVLSCSSLAYLMLDSIARKVPVPLKWSFIVSCLLSIIVSAPPLGLLADAKFKIQLSPFWVKKKSRNKNNSPTKSRDPGQNKVDIFVI